jgi:Ca2+-binding EF-hand superfamily protein
VDDIVFHLTGIELQPVKQSIREEDEFRFKKVVLPTAHDDEDLANYKKHLVKAQYNAIVQAFGLLWGKNKEDQVEDAQVDGVAALTEQNFTKNIGQVLGVEEPYFGKMLYLWMARGYDRAKITIQEFIEFLMPFKSDNKQKQLQLCFEILDIDQDKLLNILNLLHLNKNLKPRTLLSREVIMVIDEYLQKNLLNSNKRINREEINFEGYHKLVTSSCLRNEIRRKFWALAEPYEPNEPHSICEPLTAD